MSPANPTRCASSMAPIPLGLLASPFAPESWQPLWGTKQNKKKVEEEEYVVEKILGHGAVKGRVEHLLKGEGFSDEDHTWEPEENLDFPDLIAEFPQSQKTTHETEKSEGDKHKADDSKNKGKESKAKKKQEASEKPRFAWGLEPEQIIGATDSSGELMFPVKQTTLMRLTRSLPRKPTSSAHRLSYPSMRKGIPTPRRMMTKKMTRILTLLSTSPITADCGSQ
ncbi:hypothetical protein P7K49_035752, partial [Saguinus oedipus]